MVEGASTDIISRRKLDFGDGENGNQSLNDIRVEEIKVVFPENILEDKIPKIGMEFESEDAAYQFYNEYAKGAGFSIRMHYSHRFKCGKISDRVFCCDHQGYRTKDKRQVLIKSHRPETRTGCCAEMKICCRYTSKYTVVKFIAEHKGHELVSPKKAHMLRSHRRMTVAQASQIDDLDWSGIAPRASFTYISKQAGGRENVGFMLTDYKNYLRSKRTVEMKIGESGRVMEYLQERQIDDPHFCYAIQLDSEDFITNIFSSCVYDYEEEEEFFSGWQNMLDKYSLQTNEWLSRLFSIREKWALVYGRHTFCADMTSTQRSESMHSVLKRYVSYKTNIMQFFHHFDRLVAERRYDELRADLMMSQSSPAIAFPIQILKHAAAIYTHEVFELIQDELSKAYDSKLELCAENGDTFEYKVIPFRKRSSHRVLFQPSQSMVFCSCKRFEFAGIICSHILKVFCWTNTMEIPAKYIKRRWTKKANKVSFEAQSEGVSQDFSEFVNEDDEKKLIGVLYRELCSLSNQLTTRAALSKDKFEIARKGLRSLIEEVEGNPDKTTSTQPHHGPKPVAEKVIISRGAGDVHLDDIMIKGMKQKEKKPARSGKRLKSGLEMNQKKRNRSNVVTQKKDQGAGGVRNNLSMSHSIEPLSLPCVSRFQYPQADQNETSLTQLLQQQERFGELQVNFIHGSQANMRNEYIDIPRE